MYIMVNNYKLKINEMKGFWKRFRGLMFIINPIKEGFIFNNCKSVHTFFMYQSIDIIMLDKDNRILKIYKRVDSERIFFGKRKVCKVLELPLKTSNYFSVGDIIKIIP